MGVFPRSHDFGYGVPLEEFVDKFAFTKFDPSGFVEHPNIKSTTSIVDFVFRCLAYEYLNRTDLVHVLDKPEISEGALDSLKRELAAIEAKYPELVTADSPSQRVSGKPLPLL